MAARRTGTTTAVLPMPPARGPQSEAVIALLGRSAPLDSAAAAAVPVAGAIEDADVHLALTLLYELHYRGIDGVDADLEWDPVLLDRRRTLEAALLADLDAEVEVPADALDPAVPLHRALSLLLAADDGPSVAKWLLRYGTEDHVRDLVAQRSMYHLKEADFQSWALPRLSGPAKAALVEIQADEYGGGRPDRMHQQLYADAMRSIGLDDSYGHYLPRASAATLTFVNVLHLFGLHRRLRGRCVGHLAAVEATSAVPCAVYSRAMTRLGLPAELVAFYDEHVLADAVHEQVAVVDLCGALVAAEPEQRPEVLRGMATYLAMERRFGEAMIAAWEDGRLVTWPDRTVARPRRRRTTGPAGASRRTAA